MSTTLLQVHDPLNKEYSQFFRAAFLNLTSDYQGCDVLITLRVHTSIQLSSVLLCIYSQLREIASASNHGAEFSINVYLQPVKTVYASAFKALGDPAVTLSGDLSFVELESQLPQKTQRTIPHDPNSNETKDTNIESQGSQPSKEADSSAIEQSSFTEGSALCVAVGGTFDHLHDGHKILLQLTSFCASTKIIVGVTGDELLKGKKFREFLEPLSFRMNSVRKFLQQIMNQGQRFEIYQINDVCGPTGYLRAIDALIISHETTLGAAFVNKVRSEKGYGELKVVSADVVGGDGNAENNWKGKLSSTDLREIELKKRRLT